MPNYLFKCDACGSEKTVKRHYDRASAPFHHLPTDDHPEYCHGVYRRQFTVPLLTTQPRHLLDENKFANGFSATEQLENRKQWDKQYEINQAPANLGNWKPKPKSASDDD